MNQGASDVLNASRRTKWDDDLVFHALGDPVRRRILFTLIKSGPKTTSELAPGKRAAAFKHVAVLVHAGFVVQCGTKQDKRQVLYAVSPEFPISHNDSDVTVKLHGVTVTFPMGKV
jgi:DNA-binding transcriptional ArsR family regulator